MEEILGGLGIMLVMLLLGAWVVSGFGGGLWLMYKGYTMEMLGCLGLLYGAPLALMAMFGPIVLLIAWALPSRTDPSQQGGLKQMLKSKPTHRSAPSAPERLASPKRPALRAPSARRPQIPGGKDRSRPAIPSSRPANSRERPKPPMRRS